MSQQVENNRINIEYLADELEDIKLRFTNMETWYKTKLCELHLDLIDTKKNLLILQTEKEEKEAEIYEDKIDYVNV